MLLRLLDFLFPPHCAGCNRPSIHFCAQCREQLQPVPIPRLQHLDEVRALGLYAGPLQTAIANLKFRGRFGQARQLARLMDCPPGLLVPVPSPAPRQHKRGFNLAELLTRALERPWQRLLACPHDRPQQKTLTLAQRLENKPFLARGTVQGPVVLVDDVLTTGSTLISCAQALRQAGASEVRAVVAAYQSRRDVHMEAISRRAHSE